MKNKIHYFTLTIVFVFFFFAAAGQYFGKNKVNYEVFDFEIYETPHFRIYHYMSDKEQMDEFAQLCERWYHRHQHVFKDTLTSKNPIIIYNNHAEFQQTTVIQSLIGVGTGGVTEGYRKRLIMPFAVSNKETNHVLGHELVHVFQYNMFKEDNKLGLRAIGNVPIWMIEGLSEYLSIGNADVKTAMWMRDAILQNDLPSFKNMTKEPHTYFPYRYGHVFWAYMAGTYGDTIIPDLLKATGRAGYRTALENLTLLTTDTLSQIWNQRIRDTHQPHMVNKNEYEGDKIFDTANAGKINIAPSLSPDGKNLIFISDKNVISIDFYLADMEKQEITKRITNVIRDEHIDDYSFLESSGTWSPDGSQFALTTFSDGKNKLLIVNLHDEKVVRTIDIPSLDAFNNPAWSPDGNKIAVTGLQNGQSDIYIYHLNDDRVDRITNDQYSDIHPNWSPDGNKLIFVSDRTDQTNLDQLKFGNYQIASYNLNNRNITLLSLLENTNIHNPVYSPDGTEIYFVADADGFRNIYKYNINNKEIRKVTNLKTGVSGITTLSPCFDISSESEELIYILYKNSGYELHRLQLNDLDSQTFTSSDINKDAAQLVAVPQKSAEVFVDSQLDEYPLYDRSLFRTQPYDPEFSLETVGSPGVGVGVSNYGTGMSGGVSLLFSDMLKRNLLMTTLQVQGRIYDIAGRVFYLNQKNRLNWGASFSHVPFRSSRRFLKRDTLEGNIVDNLILLEQRVFEDRLGLMAQYPISKKLRLETGFSASMYSFRIDSINNYYAGRIRVERERHQVDAPEPFFVYRTYLAYTGDGSKFGLTSPMSGYRYRFQIDRSFGKYGYWGAMADIRKYFLFHPFSLGFRIMHYGRYGRSAEDIHPLYLGNEFYIRGYGFRSMSRTPCNGDDCLNVNNLVGSKMLVTNAEFRIPFSGPKRLAMIESKTFFSDLVFFADGGLIWSDFENIRMSWEPESAENLRTPVFSTGVAFRLNLFGYIILEPYYAYAFQRSTAKPEGTLGLHLSAGGF